ncbi:MAG: secretin N-terminal domain-containing protein [Methylacidiphilales bacterium]|nr:secretin N-terminal domain-containing protein [Candidatus Methylacidiphilales bacterium]
MSNSKSLVCLAVWLLCFADGQGQTPLKSQAVAPAQAPAPANPGGEELVKVQYPSAKLDDILDAYEATSGKTLLRDANIQGISGLTIHLVVPGMIPKSQALRLLESVMTLNGLSLVPGEDNSVKVLNSTSGKIPRSEGIAIYANLQDLPKGDQLASYFMPFRYLDAASAQQIFMQHLQPHPYGVIVPVPNAQALVITENASAIRQLAKLKELIDVPPAKVISQFVTLQRADAERVADTITKMIDARKSKAQGVPGQTLSSSEIPGENLTLNERTFVSGDVQLTPDPRTNRILVVTRPVNFDYIKGLIEQFDDAVTLTSPLERPLKYVMAADVLPVLETLLTESKDSQPVSSNTSNPGQPNQQNRFSQNNTSRSSSSSGSRSGPNVSADRTLQENQDTAPEAVMVGKTRLIADKQANSIIVIGPPESVDKVKSILDHLDKKPMQVYLATVIGQLTIGKNTEFAVDLLQNFSSSGNFGVAASQRTRSSATTDLTLNPRGLTSAAAFTALPAGLTLYGAIGSALNYYVKALESTSHFRVLSRPVIYTSNNKGAVIASGQRIAVPTSTLSTLNAATTTDSTSVISNIDYTDVVLKLEVVPLINSDKEVTLKIKQTNDSVVGSQVISGNSIPTIGTQSVDTTIIVPNKATVVLGGLITESNTVNVTGVPFFKDIPLLGYLFKGTTKDKSRQELIIMIQPNVVSSDEEFKAASLSEENRNQVGAEAHAFSENTPFDAKKHEAEVKAAAAAAKRGTTTKGDRTTTEQAPPPPPPAEETPISPTLPAP